MIKCPDCGSTNIKRCSDIPFSGYSYTCMDCKHEFSDEEISKIIEEILQQESELKSSKICCKYWSGGKWQYSKTSKSNCDDVGGTVVDNSKCN